ncbi:MAG: cephalosporin hydroxylase family protein [Alphaproteobacteria bacterium]|nr:cephalosporin hydroxylase family protein [Alphaproteobacteria bacterium]
MTTPHPDPITAFEEEKATRIVAYPTDADWQKTSTQWLTRAFEQHYMYNFSWLGRPVIQLPGDMVALQEIIWAVKPDLIIETGIAHGGSLILSASMLAMLDYCEAATQGTALNPKETPRCVLGIDIDIRTHNRAAIEAHPLAHMITMVEGSSIDEATIAQVKKIAANYKKILVCLDSHHTHAHVLAELEAYAPLVSVGSYCLVFDTIVETLPDGLFSNRPWAQGNNPRTAVWEYLRRQEEGKTNAIFEIDKSIENKLLLTASPDGFLKRIS